MQPNQPYQQNPAPQTPQASDYSFITNPETPVTKRSLSGSGSPVLRGLIVLGGLIVLIILFNLIKGFLNSDSAGPAYLNVAQDQQSMIHILEIAIKEPSITGTNKNFAYTADLSLSSDRSKTIKYLTLNGTKVNEKIINLKVSQQLDQQLTDAAAASNYNLTFAQIMKTKLTNYDQALQQAYGKTKGPKGRELLKSEHKNTELLVAQLEAANK